ncbi:hypothetical protein [Chromobacterium subtsugae]|uniref:hypothetical protein n=1 Tax=Chromobacterium subtsugae TaxID=251747 RepID=UPI000641492D|nr:hypothetical protein [Chromobacterium subtsugae]
MTLKDFLRGLGDDQCRSEFAARCGTSLNYLKSIAYNRNGKGKSAKAWLAVAIDRESQGAVSMEALCPEFDWGYLRQRLK